MANTIYSCPWLVIFIGFFSGGILLYFGDLVLNYFAKKGNQSISYYKRSILLFFSITLHNIPEGLVLGVAFGSIFYSMDYSSLLSALTLTLGIAIQNFPEGSAISLPLRRDGMSPLKSFLFGSLSGIVEPIAAIFGALLILKIQIVLPFVMAFTAGAMIFVVLVELIPDILMNPKFSMMSLIIMLGFSIMMILELILI